MIGQGELLDESIVQARRLVDQLEQDARDLSPEKHGQVARATSEALIAARQVLEQLQAGDSEAKGL